MNNQNLFQANLQSFAPLSEKIRPQDWSEVFGQENLTQKNGILNRLTQKNELPSLIFWGPPGTGKTTLARIIAQKTSSHFVQFSAVNSGINELKTEVKKALDRSMSNTKTIIFLDEIHRWNKAQQDTILPYIEDGTFTLIGATTENPSFEINSALLSRCEVIILKALDEKSLNKILERALKIIDLKLNKKAKDFLVKISNADARTLLNRLDILKKSFSNKKNITELDVKKILNQKNLRYDKDGEEHYNLISALHKSMRGSDPDAALYYLVRMLESGENPHYVIRRIVRFASEDIGNADPSALAVALRAKDAYDFLGSPEGELAIAQAAIYCACCSKSNSIYKAYNQVKMDIKEFGNLEIPKKLRNAPTKFMKKIGYGKDYKYAHDFQNAIVPNEKYLPVEIENRQYYLPTERGLELQIKKRLEKIKNK